MESLSIPSSFPSLFNLLHYHRVSWRASFVRSSSRKRLVLSKRQIPASFSPCGTRGSSTITQSVLGSKVEEEEELEFIEVGYVSSSHGVKGELRVEPSTDFPELRFNKSGRRWLRSRVLGKNLIREVELNGGRAHPGKKSWIISLNGIDSVEKAKQIVGSTLLVKEYDRPDLEEGEFYTPDLVGMKVLVKETGECVGTVINVVNYGASDLLRVTRSSAAEVTPSPDILWIPFVQEIVPDVDMVRREMSITPPKGLLELNLRSDAKSKKERRRLEWKEKKKLNHQLVAAKRQLREMGQNHLLEALKHGEKIEQKLLANQIVRINMTLFRQALRCIGEPLERISISEFIEANYVKLMHYSFPEDLFNCGIEGNGTNYELYHKGLKLFRESKAAIVLVVSNNASAPRDGPRPDETAGDRSRISESNLSLFGDLLLDFKRVLKVEDELCSVPLIVVAAENQIKLFEELFHEKGFGFDAQKVWFLEEEKLPIVGGSDGTKVLMKSPSEMIWSPVGDGGVFSLLSSHKIIEELQDMGVEYVQVCSFPDNTHSSQLFFGCFSSSEADSGIEVFKGCDENGDAKFNMILTMKSLTRVCRETDKLRLYTTMEEHEPVEQVGSEWVRVQPVGPNSYRFHFPIYSFLSCYSSDKVFAMHVSEFHDSCK